MLAGNFFTIESLEEGAGIIKASMEINAAHEIFEGHFPGQPVVPGVCMVQMIKELVEHSLAKQTRLMNAADIKFLAVINPVVNNKLNAEIKYTTAEDGNVSLTASLTNGDLVHLKCRCTLLIV